MRAPFPCSLLLSLLVGCADEPLPAPPPSEPPPIVALPSAGLSGQIRYLGGKRDARVPGWAEVPACAKGRGEGALLVGPEGGLSGVLVTLVGTPPAPGPGAPVEIVARGCRFEPRVVVVAPAFRLRVANEDPLLHSFHLREPGVDGALGASVQNLVVPPGTEPVEYEIKGRRRLQLRSDAQPWMKAWVLAGGPDLQVVTDAEGRFAIPDLPPGSYRLRLWHEQLGTVEESAEVTVPADGPASYSFAWTDSSGG